MPAIMENAMTFIVLICLPHWRCDQALLSDGLPEGTVALVSNLPESLRKPLIFLEADLNGHHQALGLGSSCFTNQVAAKNRLIGGRILQSRGELDGVASP